jgi:hypothetical protein
MKLEELVVHRYRSLIQSKEWYRNLTESVTVLDMYEHLLTVNDDATTAKDKERKPTSHKASFPI